MSYNKINGTPWHVGTLKMKDDRRHKSRCKYYNPNNSCGYFEKCIGSSHCQYYRERTPQDEIIQNKQKDKQNEKNKTNIKKTTNNRKYFVVGDSFLLLNIDNGELLNYKIVSKANESRRYLKIVCDDPLANKVIRSKVGKRIKVYENKKLQTFEILRISLMQ